MSFELWHQTTQIFIEQRDATNKFMKFHAYFAPMESLDKQ